MFIIFVFFVFREFGCSSSLSSLFFREFGGSSSLSSLSYLSFQGVWVFIIFVCKRNVLRVLQGKSRNLYNSLAKSLSRNMSSKFHLQTKDMLTIVLSIPVPMRTTVSETSQASRTDATSMSMSDSSPADSNGDPLLSKN